MSFKPEPKYVHGQTPQVGVLLINLGTPSEPTASSVRSYLKEFLSDRRVVEIPKIIWNMILYGIILPFRSKKSAKKYKTIWTPEGSPLLIHTKNQAKNLQSILQNLGKENIKVAYAMRYNTPSIKNAMQELKDSFINKLIVLPLYPQYCSATTGSSIEAVFKELNTWRVIPSIHTINYYHDHPTYIKALADSIREHWNKIGKPNFPTDKLLMSFHGVPERTLQLGDYYHCQCYKTARLVALELGLNKDDYMVSFQSRLGKAKWLEPYTDVTIEKLAKSKARVDVICPGFSSDCLETLEEINMENRELFMHHGGKQFEYIPCLNDSIHGMSVISKLVLEQDIQTYSKKEMQESKEAFECLQK